MCNYNIRSPFRVHCEKNTLRGKFLHKHRYWCHWQILVMIGIDIWSSCSLSILFSLFNHILPLIKKKGTRWHWAGFSFQKLTKRTSGVAILDWQPDRGAKDHPSREWGDWQILHRYKIYFQKITLESLILKVFSWKFILESLI